MFTADDLLDAEYEDITESIMKLSDLIQILERLNKPHAVKKLRKLNSILLRQMLSVSDLMTKG